MFRVVRDVVSMFGKSDTFSVWNLSELGEQGTALRHKRLLNID